MQAAALSRELVQRVHAAGNVTELELATARAYEEDAHLQLEDAELRTLAYRAELVRLLGVSREPAALSLELRLPEPEAAEPPLAAIEKQALERSLELLALQRGHEALDAQATATQVAGVIPDLRAGVVVERDDGDVGMGPIAALSLPIFDHGQGEVSRLRAQQNVIEHERAATQNQIRAYARTLRERATTLSARVRRYQLVLVPLRSKIVRETELQYNAMQIGATQWITAKRDELRASQAQVAALHAYWGARAALDQLLAGRLPMPMSRASEAAMHGERRGEAYGMEGTQAADPGGH